MSSSSNAPLDDHARDKLMKFVDQAGEPAKQPGGNWRSSAYLKDKKERPSSLGATISWARQPGPMKTTEADVVKMRDKMADRRQRLEGPSAEGAASSSSTQTPPAEASGQSSSMASARVATRDHSYSEAAKAAMAMSAPAQRPQTPVASKAPIASNAAAQPQSLARRWCCTPRC